MNINDKARKRLVLAMLALSTCSLYGQTNSPTTVKTCSHSECNAAALSDRSIYQLDSEWTNDTGRTTKLAELRGKPQVVAMIYTSCMGACPLLVHQMQDLARSLPPDTATNAGFLLVTFDPERDTPKALHAYRITRQLDEKWTMLRGRPEDAQELALVLGINYRRGAQGQFSHSSVITLLNAEGEVAFQQTGLDSSSEQLAEHLKHLLKP